MTNAESVVLDPARMRRVLVMRLDNVGDVVLLTPALRALRAALPVASITLLASPAGAQLAPLLPWVDDVRAVRALWQDTSGSLPFDPAREQSFVDDLARERYDAALIATSFSQSPHAAAYACYLAGVPVRAALAPDFAGGVLSCPVAPPSEGTHQVDRALALLAGLGVPPAGTHLELRVPSATTQAVRRTLHAEGVDGPYAVVAPGASCPTRRYDPGRFAQVGAGLTCEVHLPVVVVGSAREQALADGIADAADRSGCGIPAVSLAGRTGVPELAAVVAGAALVVTNNSGPLHVAEAFHRPTVALFAGTERESEFAPRHAPLRLLRRATTCAPCRAFTCPFAHECLDIPPDEVVTAALGVLSASRLPVPMTG